ncbi:chorismate-binding protein [Desulfobacter hydrogenophilus]|uniref:chorismate-binding protein n=1 Tax=Desulfobacter hydrogenophilus TaxID=2291 RepID=UPI0013D8729B|nr:chorismate-binding protein [Desulfobacter hydrogenophilus]NDY70526.1 hypothetical protein [Desulfobacter hydrogenophilus]
MFKKNPTPFVSFVQGGNCQRGSTSSERFFKVENQTVEIRLIKGTIARGSCHRLP